MFSIALYPYQLKHMKASSYVLKVTLAFEGQLFPQGQNDGRDPKLPFLISDDVLL